MTIALTILMAIVQATPAPRIDDEVKVAIIGVIGLAVTAVGTVLAARFAARASTRANEQNVTAVQTPGNVYPEELKTLVTGMQSELVRLGGRVESLEDGRTKLQGRVDDLETQLRSTEGKYRMALTYIHDVIAWTKTITNTTSLPPVAPDGIAEDLDKL